MGRIANKVAQEVAFKDVQIDRPVVLKSLAPRREPYWGRRLRPNQSLGYRKIDSKTGSWIARLKKDGKREYAALGIDTESFGYDEARKAAEAWFANHNKEKVEGDLTVRAACAAYVKVMREQKKQESTAHDAEMRFARVVDDSALGRVLVANLRKHHVQTWINELKMSPASLARTFTCLRAALNLSIRQEKVGVEVRQAWTALEFPAIPDGSRKLFLDLRQRRKLLKAAKGGLRDLIEGAMLTGCRAGELVNAKVGQFDPRTGKMEFIGKTGARVVPLAAPALALFKRLTKGKPASAHIFTRDDGLRWNHSDWDELVRAAAKKAGLPDGTVLYTLRHSFINQAIAGGLSTLDVARLVGTSLMMIEKTYGKLIPDAALKRLAAVKFV